MVFYFLVEKDLTIVNKPTIKDISLLRLAAFQTVAQLLPTREPKAAAGIAIDILRMQCTCTFVCNLPTHHTPTRGTVITTTANRDATCGAVSLQDLQACADQAGGSRGRGGGPSPLFVFHVNVTCVCISGLPRWLSGKESVCQCRLLGFDPWVGKIPWSRQWQPTPGFLPGKSNGQGSLAGYSPWGHKESDITERAHTHVSISAVVFLR